MQNRNNAAHLLTTALVLLTSLQVISAAPPKGRGPGSATPPKLIVGIAIDQLRTDYLEALRDRMTDGGFNRLLRQGRVYEQVTFDLDNPDATAALAVLATGAYPFRNGVPAQQVYDTRMARRQSVFYDPAQHGINTVDGLSPRSLISTTLADELKTASLGAARVYAIAPDAEAAILAGGHTANGVLWLDDRGGKWASSDYYPDFPAFVTDQNSSQPFFLNVKKAVWEPLAQAEGPLDIMPYRYAASSPFAHKFFYHGLPCYTWLKTSPFVNDAVLQISERLLQDKQLGARKHTDMLQLTFYAGTYLHERPELYAEELQDIYLRLDQTIATLLDLIDRSVGLDNTYIYMVGTGATCGHASSADVEGTRLGEFNAHRCTALLNAHLISLYGKAQWIAGYDNGHIFLNHDAIEAQRLKVSEVQQAAAEFVAMMKGVDEVVTNHQLLHEDFSERIVSRRNAYHKHTGGDLLLSLQPGWVLKADEGAEPQPQVRHDVAPGPAILFAPKAVAPARISVPVQATHIAPTVAHSLRIRAPSACREPALTEPVQSEPARPE